MKVSYNLIGMRGTEPERDSGVHCPKKTEPAVIHRSY